MSSDIIDIKILSIPKTESDITEEWISKAVGLTPLPDSVSITGNIQDGVGFLSNLCRVSFQTESGPQNILVKLLPTSPDFRALTLEENFDEREIQFYTITYPKIIEIAPHLEQYFCHVYCGKVSGTPSSATDEDYASMLVMKDLKPLGYHMLNPESDKWEAHLEKLVQFLAHFHVASLTLEQSTNTKISEHFPFCMGVGELKFDALGSLAKTNATRLVPFLEQNNCSPEIIAAYKEILGDAESGLLLVLSEDVKHPCLIHGDIWPPNIMITEGGDLPVKIIDWQLLAYRDSVVELTVAILTCLPKAGLKRKDVDKFCHLYYQTCQEISVNLDRSEEQFKECFDTWGMTYAYYWFLMSFDSYPDDPKKLYLAFEFLQKEYKVCEFLKSKLKK